MNLEEARAELGVAPDASPDTVRRAYLRLLKTRKPEVDPQGFARLREAYDVLKAAQEGTEAPRTQAAPEQPAPAAPPAGPAVPLTADQRLEAFRARFRSLPADAPADMPVQVAREAVEALPEAAEARHWLIKALLAAGSKDAAVQACREAYQQGHPEFLPELARSFPECLTDPEIDLLASMVQPSFLWGLADHLMSLKEGARMATVALVALEAVKQTPGTPPPQPAWFISAILELHEQGHLEQARQLQKRYAEWIMSEDLADAFERDRVAWAWPLVVELGALDDGCAQEVRAILAHAVLTDEIDEAKVRLAAWRREHPEQVAGTRKLLETTCPGLERVLGEALEARWVPKPASPSPAPVEQKPEAPREKKPESRRSRQVFTVLGILAVLLVASAIPALILGSDTPESQPRQPAQQWPIVANPGPTARAAAQELCEAIPASNRGSGCLYIEELIKAAESSDCVSVTRNFAQLIANVQRAPDPRHAVKSREEVERQARIRKARTTLEASIRTLCPRAF